MADRFEDLRNYVAVVDNGGVNAAAQALGIAKSAVSRRLGELEARLGVALVDRSARRLELTALGREYHLRARAVLAALDELDDGVGIGGGPDRRISVAVDARLGTRLVAPVVTTFQSANPDVAIDLLTRDDDTVADVTVCIAGGGVRSGPQTLLLCPLRLTLCAAPSYLAERGTPTTLSDLASHRAIAVAGAPIELKGSGPLAARTLLSVPDVDSAAAAALAGGGIAQLPELAVADAVSDGRLVTLLEDRAPPPASVIATFSPDSPMEARRLADHLAAAPLFAGTEGQ